MSPAPSTPPGPDLSALRQKLAEAAEAFRNAPYTPPVTMLPRSLYDAVARDPRLKHLVESGRVIPPGDFDE